MSAIQPLAAMEHFSWINHQWMNEWMNEWMNGLLQNLQVLASSELQVSLQSNYKNWKMHNEKPAKTHKIAHISLKKTHYL